MSCFYLFLLQNSAGWMHRQQIFPRSACPINIGRFKKPKRKKCIFNSICQFIQIRRASLYLQRYNLWQRGLLKAEYVDTFVSTSFCIMGQLTKHTVSVVNRSEATTRVQYQQGRAWKHKLYRYICWILILNGWITSG